MPESGRKDSVPIPGIHGLLENTASLVGRGGPSYNGTEIALLTRNYYFSLMEEVAHLEPSV